MAVKINRMNKDQKKPILQRLGDIEPGNKVVILPEKADSYDKAMENPKECFFFIHKPEAVPEKQDTFGERITVISLDGKQMLKRDSTLKVISCDYEINIDKPKTK